MVGGEKLCAASGLVSVEEQLFVVPDDGLSLGCFDQHLEQPGIPRRLFSDAPLPHDHAQAKMLKPDQESLTLVPASYFGHQSLLSVGSGSLANRQRGVLMPVEEGQEPQVFNLGPLYDFLRTRFPTLNIEGLALQGDLLRMLQRGNGENVPNAIIDLDAAAFFEGVQAGTVGPEAFRSSKEVELGRLDGVRLSFTDLTPTRDGHFLFTASAEDTGNPVDDGKVAGSVIGRMNRDGTIESMRRLDREFKVEGVDIGADGKIRLVTDADSSEQAAELFTLNESQDFFLAR